MLKKIKASLSGVIGRLAKRFTPITDTKSKVIEIVWVPNIFSKDGRMRTKVMCGDGENLCEILEKNRALFDLHRNDHRFIVNGKEEAWNFIPQNNDEVLVTPKIGRAYAPMLMAVGFSLLGLWGFNAMGDWALLQVGALGITSSAQAAMLGFALGGILGGLLFPPKFDIKGNLDSGTYSWSGIKSSTSPDMPVPIVYGEHRVGGQYVNMYVTNDEVLDWKYIYYSDADWHEETGNTCSFVFTGMGCKFDLHPLSCIPASVGLERRYTTEDGVIKCKPLVYTPLQSTLVPPTYVFLGFSVYIRPWTEEGTEPWEFKYRVYPSDAAVTYGIPGIEIIPQVFLENGSSFYTIECDTEGMYQVRIVADDTGVVSFPDDKQWWTSLYVKELTPSIYAGKSFLNALMAVSEGEIEGITKVEVDKQPLSFYDDGDVLVSERKGTNTQDAIPEFSEIHALQTTNTPLTDAGDVAEYTTTQTVDRFVIVNEFVLYQMDDEGDLMQQTLQYRVWWKRQNTQDYLLNRTITVTKVSTSPFIQQFKSPELIADVYNIKVERITADITTDKSYGKMTVIGVDEILDDSLSYPNTALVGIKAVATEKLSGGVPDITSLVRGVKVLQPKMTNEDGDEVEYDETYYDADAEEYKLVADDSSVTLDTNTWVARWTANPIWILYDLVTNERYGLGKHIKDGSGYSVDRNDLVAMAEYCDVMVDVEGSNGRTAEKRFRLDIVIDAQQSAVDLIQAICQTFRCFSFVSNSKFHFVIDKEESPVQLFGMGNIISGSFSETFASAKESPNTVEVSFVNKNESWERDIVLWEDEADLEDNPLRKKSFTLNGIVRPSQAMRMAKYFLFAAKYCVRGITFKCASDAFLAQPGDVFTFAHDVPQWSDSGSVESGTTEIVYFKSPITTTGGVTYELSVRTSAGSCETVDVSSFVNLPDGKAIGATLATALSEAPASGCPFVLTKKTIGRKNFRAMTVSREPDGTASVMAMEYNADVYDETGVVEPTPNYSSLKPHLLPITALSALSGCVVKPDGSQTNTINVSFVKPAQQLTYSHANIYISTNGESWLFVGSTKSEFFSITSGIVRDTLYYIAVASVDKFGKELAERFWTQTTCLAKGKELVVSDVTGFSAVQVENVLYFEWNEISDYDVDGYEIRRGCDWNTATFVAFTGATSWQTQEFPSGVQTFLIKARDTSGTYSENTTAVSITLVLINKKHVISFEDRATEATTGDCYKEKNETASNEFRDCLTPYTTDPWDDPDATTWGDDETNEAVWGTPVVTGDITYETAATDIGFIVTAIPSVTTESYSDGNATVTIKEKHSEDNITWTPYAEISATPVTFRYIQFEVVLNSSVDSETCQYFYLKIDLDLAQKTENIANKAIDSAGTAVLFSSTFSYDDVVVEITPRTSGLVPYTTDTTKAGCTVYLLDTGGNAVSGNVDILVSGY